MAQTDVPQLTRKQEIERIVKNSKKTSFKDLPRLTKRINIIDNTQSKNEVILSKGVLIAKNDNNNNDNDNKANDNNDNTNWKRITNILLCLSQQCLLTNSNNSNKLVDDKLRVILNDINLISSLSSHDYPSELNQIFTSNKLLNTDIIRIINGCNQLVIFGAFSQLLREYFIPQGFVGMKDVRTEYGWQIFIYFNKKGIIRILHKRQTQYCKPPDDQTKWFLVNWELDMSFPPGLQKCNSVFVRVNGIEFNDNVDSNYKMSVQTKLVGGDLIFH